MNELLSKVRTPRGMCKTFMRIGGVDKPVYVSEQEFRELIEGKEFTRGPCQAGFPIGLHRKVGVQAYGILKDGRGVFCFFEGSEERLTAHLESEYEYIHANQNPMEDK